MAVSGLNPDLAPDSGGGSVRTASEAGLGTVKQSGLPGTSQQQQSMQIPAGGVESAIGVAARQLGVAGEDVTNFVLKMKQEQDALVANDLANKFQRELITATTDPDTGFLAQQGGNTIGLTSKADARMTELRQKYGAMAGNSVQQQLFERAANSAQQSTLESVARHTLVEQKKFRSEQADSTIKLARDSIGLNPRDQAAFDKNLNLITSATMAKAGTAGLSEEGKASAKREARSLAEATRAQQLLQSNDPNDVIDGSKYFRDAHDEGVLDLESVDKLETLEKSQVPKALARRELPKIQAQSGDFQAMAAEQIFTNGIIPSESGGRRYSGKIGADGKPELLTSTAGAKGEAQVLDSTNLDPGYGVVPAKDNSPEERARVGRDYFVALSKHYGNNTLATMAYNAGPGALDDFMNGTNDTGKNPDKIKLGDPRNPGSGFQSMSQFIANFPFQETRNYVLAVQKRAGVGSGKIDLNLAMTRANELEAQYPGAGSEFLSTVNSQNSEVEKMLAQRNATFNSDFKIAVNRGEKTYNDIEDAYDNGDITPEQRSGYIMQLDEVNGRTLKEAAGAQRVNALLNGDSSVTLDPKKSEDKKAVDANYKLWAQNISDTRPDITENEARSAQLDLIGRYGMVPETLQSSLRGQLRSTDPRKKVAAATMLDQLRQKNPALLNDFAEEDIKDAMHIQAYVQAGYDPQAASDIVVEQQKVTPQVRELRQQQYKEALKDKSSESTIHSELTSNWPFVGPSTIIPAAMQGDFERLAQAEFLRTGNLESSNKVAATLIQKTWSPTSVGGFSVDGNDSRGYWMKNPPEKYYAAEGQSDQSKWMRQQLLDDVNSLNTLSPDKFKDGDLTLTVSNQPGPDGRPTYNVWYKKDGVINIWGGPDYVWHPDWESSKTRKELLDKQKFIAEANAGKVATTRIIAGGF